MNYMFESALLYNSIERDKQIVFFIVYIVYLPIIDNKKLASSTLIPLKVAMFGRYTKGT